MDEVGPLLERDRSDAVKCILSGLRHAQTGPKRGTDADHQRDRPSLQRVDLDLLPDDRKLAEHRALDRLLRARIALQHEPRIVTNTSSNGNSEKNE